MDHLEVRLRDVPDREVADRMIRELAAKLERQCDHVTSCHVAVERPNLHPLVGARWRVRIEVRVAGAEPVVVRREQGDAQLHDALSTLVHDAFHSAGRQLKELTRKQRGDVKAHPAQMVQGVIAELHEDFGRVASIDGRSVYFHAHSLLGTPFEELRPGMGVAFTEEEGDEGPQASTLRVVDARGRA